MNIEHSHCPFCNLHDANIIHQNDFGLIMHDDNPVSKGHALIVPHRHISSFFDVTENERKSLVNLLELARNDLKMRFQPDGFHVGFNDGNVVGQRIEHLHIHVIPRYSNQALHLDKRWGVVSGQSA